MPSGLAESEEEVLKKAEAGLEIKPAEVSPAPDEANEPKMAEPEPESIPSVSPEKEAEISESSPPPPEDLPVADAAEKPVIRFDSHGNEIKDEKEPAGPETLPPIDLTEEIKPDIEPDDQKKTEDILQETIPDQLKEAADNLVDRVRVWWSDKLFRQHELKAAELFTGLREREDNIRNLEVRRTTLISEHKIAESMAGSSGRHKKTEIREIRDVEDRLRREKNEKNRLQTALERENARRAAYENKVKDIVERMDERIQKKLTPYEKKVEKTQEERDQLDLEIRSFASVVDKTQRKISELEARKERALSEALKSELERLIEAARGAQRGAEANIQVRGREREAIEKRCERANDKAQVWRDKHDTLALYTQRKEIAMEPGPRVRESINHERRSVKYQKQRSSRAPEHSSDYGHEVVESAEKKEFTPVEYAAAWNKYFGSEIRIREDEVAGIFKGEADEKMSARLLNVFLTRHLRKHTFSERKIEQKLRSLETYLSYE